MPVERHRKAGARSAARRGWCWLRQGSLYRRHQVCERHPESQKCHPAEIEDTFCGRVRFRMRMG
jgi:hypothetical protein